MLSLVPRFNFFAESNIHQNPFDMSLLERFGKFFVGKSRPSLKQLSLDALRREYIAVETELEKLGEENDRIECDDSQLKEEYRAAHGSNRVTLKKTIARKLQNLELKRKGIETRLAYTNKMFRTIIGMITIKENMEFFDRVGVGSVIGGMDIGELENYVVAATVEGTLQQEKLAVILQEVSEGVDALTGSAQETEIDDYMASLDAELLGDSDPVFDGENAAFEDVLRDIDAASRGIDVARKKNETRNDGSGSREELK